MKRSKSDRTDRGAEHTNESRRRVLIAVGTTLAVGLAGCASDDTDGSGDTQEDGDSAGDDGTDEETPTEEGEEIDLDREFDGWPMFRYDERNTGYAPGESAPTGDVEELWTFAADGWPTSAPLIIDGTVYFGTHEGNLHAVDAQTATEEWTVDLSSEQVNNLTMVDGSLYAPTFDDVLHALDPGNGDEQWRFEADGSVEPPAVGDGTLYFGSNADIVYALDIETGEEQWTFETGANAVMTPALVDGTVIATEYDPDIGVGSDDSDGGDGVVYALDADSGEEQWRFGSLGACQTSPTVADGTVYVGANDGSVYALDVETGEKQWSHETYGGVKASMSIAGGTLYVVPQGDTMWGLDAETGERLWRAGNDLANLAPTVVDGTAFVVADHSVKAFDGADGEKRWEFELENRPWSAATVVDDTAFFGSNNGLLYAISDQ